MNSVDRQQFDLIKRKHGGYASWAVWAPATAGPKSNVGDLSVLDLDESPATLGLLKTDVLMVGLNISRPFPVPLRNFHDPSRHANDFKIRYAFTGTPYYGAYMTDIIKDVVLVKSTDLRAHLREHPELVELNVATFRQELADLGSRRPTVLAFGAAAYDLLSENLSSQDYQRLVRLTHYSHQINKEKYRDTVMSQLESQQDG